jgi:hypothetical protein
MLSTNFKKINSEMFKFFSQLANVYQPFWFSTRLLQYVQRNPAPKFGTLNLKYVKWGSIKSKICYTWIQNFSVIMLLSLEIRGHGIETDTVVDDSVHVVGSIWRHRWGQSEYNNTEKKIVFPWREQSKDVDVSWQIFILLHASRMPNQ